jgi:hypothetical protein
MHRVGPLETGRPHGGGRSCPFRAEKSSQDVDPISACGDCIQSSDVSIVYATFKVRRRCSLDARPCSHPPHRFGPEVERASCVALSFGFVAAGPAPQNLHKDHLSCTRREGDGQIRRFTNARGRGGPGGRATVVLEPTHAPVNLRRDPRSHRGGTVPVRHGSCGGSSRLVAHAAGITKPFGSVPQPSLLRSS